MNTPITTNELSILGATVLGEAKTWRPARTFNLGLPTANSNNQLQVLKAAPITGVPKPAQDVHVTRTRVGNNIKVSVAFTSNPSDQNFQTTQVVLQQGLGSPTVVASSPQSPISFTVPSSSVGAAVTAQTVGRFGDSNLNLAPTKSLSLL